MFKRTENLQVSLIKQMELKAAKIPDAVSLSQGIPSFDTPSCVKRRAEKALQEGVVAKYSLTTGLQELRELIEQELAKNKMYYDYDQEIIITVGAIEAITSSLLTILEPGQEVLLPDPSYASYQQVVRLSGGKPVFVPLSEEDSWALDLDKIKKAITKNTKAILFCNPNNPTGTLYSKKQLLELAQLVEKFNLYVISDEVYDNFIFDSDESKNNFFSLAMIPELRKRIIRVNSFSKSYAMTGWRIGYLHSDKSMVKEILKVHDGLVTCASVISQYAAMGALEMGESDIKNFKIQYQKRRDLICKRLDSLNDIFSYQKPVGAYYVFPSFKPFLKNNHKFSKINSLQMALMILEKAKVALVPGIAFGPSGEFHLRMSFCRTEKDINLSFDRMEKLFHSIL